MNKCVFVIGPESSGSMLIAKICSHVLGIHEYGEWNGVAWSDKGHSKVCHRSLPYGNPSNFPSLEKWISENKKDYRIYFILTTRDDTISQLSRYHRWGRTFEQSQKDSEKAKEIMTAVINGRQLYFIWSYETFMFLKQEYLQCLYQFLNVKSDFIPTLIDGNRSKVNEIGTFQKIKRKLTHSLTLLKNSAVKKRK